MDSIENNNGILFFLDGPGGAGKTFLANLILAKVRQSGKIAVAVASSGIAATLLNDGKTAHSTFKLPLTVSLEQQSVCSIRKNGPLGKLLQEASLIICDECIMAILYIYMLYNILWDGWTPFRNAGMCFY